MQKVILNRSFQNSKVTLGMLKVCGDEHAPIYTLENPWLMNKRMISCVPPGRYLCEPFSGKKYRNVWELQKVPNRDFILIHSGNLEKHTHGCILLGMSAGQLKAEPAVLQSKAAIEYFRSLLARDSFHLFIRQG